MGFGNRSAMGAGAGLDVNEATFGAAEEGIQNPTDQADDECAEDGAPKSGHVEGGDEGGDQPEEKSVENENEDSHGYKDEGDAEDEEDGADAGVEDAEDEGGSEEGGEGIVGDSGEDSRSDDGDGGDQPAEEKAFHCESGGSWVRTVGKASRRRS